MTDKEKQDKYNQLIANFKSYCQGLGWIDSSSTLGDVSEGLAIFNKSLENVKITDVGYIIVADNPGKREMQNSTYLYDDGTDKMRSGYLAHRIFDKIFSSHSYIILNKTPIYTNVSRTLNNCSNSNINITKVKLEESMEYMAQLVFEINKLQPSILVYVFGIGGLFDYKTKKLKNGLWKSFYKKLKDLYKNNGYDLLFPILLPHFSNGQFLSDLNLTLNYLLQMGRNLLLSRMKNRPYTDHLQNWEFKKKRKRR